MFQRLWEENKRFLMVTGGALLVFLVARSCVIGPYEAGATETVDENSKLKSRLDRLARPIERRFNIERSQLDEYLDIERDLRQRFCLRVPDDAALVKPGTAKEVLFTQKIDRIWGEVYPKARLINSKLPEKISIRDLGMRPEDTEADLKRHTLYLEILRRALNVLVDSGMHEIGSPHFQPEVEYFIRGNERHRIVFRKIDFKVRGPYDSFVQVLRECQKKSGAFIQALVLDMDPRRAGPDALNGRVEFGGFSIEEAPGEIVEAAP